MNLRASTAHKHGVNRFLRITALYYFYRPISVSAQDYVEPHFAPSLKLYHSITQPQMFVASSLPREDYTLNQDVAEANRTITKLCKQSKTSEASELFDEMPERDAISWSTLISGYIKCGLIREARELFDRIDCRRSVVTWTVMVSGYLKTNRISEAERIFDEMPEKNVITWNTMIDGYVRSDRIEKSLSLFERMKERNVVSWNMIISGLVNVGRIEKAKGLFNEMPIKDIVSWTTMISGLTKNGKIDEARFLFDTMPERNVVSWNTMITGYLQNLQLKNAYHLFERMPQKNVQSWNIMISGFIQNRDLDTARNFFDMMPGKNVVSWTTMINGYLRYGNSEEALKMFFFMNMDGKVKPNDWTFVSVLGACADLADLGEGMQVHQVITKTAYQNSEFVISALINMYSKCGELFFARKVFDDVSRGERDIVSWNSMIVAYSHHGRAKEAIDVFEEMRNTGLKPNDVTYVGLLSACSHAGLVNEGLSYFEMLLRDGSVKVREDHYTCVVDLYGRAGRLKEALDLLENLPWKASGHVWGALLLGCNIHRNVDLGKMVADKILAMGEANAGVYMLMCNMYSSSGKREEAEMVKLKMKEDGLKKQPGCSWIEVGNKFHVFAVGNCSRGKIDGINFVLFDLHEKMKKIGNSLEDAVVLEEILT